MPSRPTSYKPIGDIVTTPSWNALRELAAAQAGYFSSTQASAAGFSPQLLYKHARGGKLEHPLRGVYRIAMFPPAEHEDLVAHWLWSKRAGVFTHETALALHKLSDAMPSSLHMTLPTTGPRRTSVPKGLKLHYTEHPKAARSWVGPVPVSNPARAVLEVAEAGGDVDLVAQAINEGIRSGRFGIEDVATAAKYIAEQHGWT